MYAGSVARFVASAQHGEEFRPVWRESVERASLGRGSLGRASLGQRSSGGTFDHGRREPCEEERR